MVQVGLLASTVLMGVFTAALVIVLANGRRWRSYSPAGLPMPRRESDDPLSDRPGMLALGFLLIVFAVGGAVVLLVGGLETMGSPAPGVNPAIAVTALLGLLLAGFIAAGSYSTARSHGAGNASAVMIGFWALGLLFVAAIAAQLLLA